MTPGLLQFLTKHAAVAPSPKHQQILDNTFSTHDDQRWRDFRRAARSKGFVNAVKSDERADSKMKRYAEALNMHYQGKGPLFPVPGTGKTHTVKYHEPHKRWSCSCPDWGYARSHQTDKNEQDCKHIKMVKLEIKSRAQAGIKEKMASPIIIGRAARSLLKQN
jgi:hypothetical protein